MGGSIWYREAAEEWSLGTVVIREVFSGCGLTWAMKGGEDVEGKRSFQEEERALQKRQRWERARPLWCESADTGPEGVWEERRGS